MNEMIKVLHLEDKIRAKVKTLSGGQKRKLSVGIALISGSKVNNHKTSNVINHFAKLSFCHVVGPT